MVHQENPRDKGAKLLGEIAFSEDVFTTEKNGKIQNYLYLENNRRIGSKLWTNSHN